MQHEKHPGTPSDQLSTETKEELSDVPHVSRLRKYLRRTLIALLATGAIAAGGAAVSYRSHTKQLSEIETEVERLMRSNAVANQMGSQKNLPPEQAIEEIIAYMNEHLRYRDTDDPDRWNFIMGDFAIGTNEDNEKKYGRCGGLARTFVEMGARRGFEDARIYFGALPASNSTCPFKMHYYGVLGANDRYWMLTHGSDGDEFGAEKFSADEVQEEMHASHRSITLCLQSVRPVIIEEPASMMVASTR